MGRRVHLGLIGLKPDWPNASLMPSYMIDSLKSLLSPDFYFEMNKTFDVAATSELIILLEKRIFEEASPIPGNNDGSTLLNRGSNETLNDSDTEELPACPFLELQDDEFISEFSTPKKKERNRMNI
ncbi:Hypothetical protein FKW44_001034 [Caligus rogercresseyi]|uniref:Uncharacterized protein n=1 Tax=Caligus rogercresseyi TaxID=217165 RepID=A0A7T8QV95_CALRO|nr:Hypothetical protein FKW44_001034 [Caligus rogercresseyi]